MTAMEAFKTKLDAAQARMAELKAQMFKETDAAFTGLFGEFFAAHPEVRTIHWTQYTPYFNDGDPCTFGVNEVNFSSLRHDSDDLDAHEDDIDVSDIDRSTWKKVPKPGKEALFEAIKGIRALVSGMEDYLLQRFDDHKHIKVHRDGVEVEDYDHD